MFTCGAMSPLSMREMTGWWRPAAAPRRVCEKPAARRAAVRSLMRRCFSHSMRSTSELSP